MIATKVLACVAVVAVCLVPALGQAPAPTSSTSSRANGITAAAIKSTYANLNSTGFVGVFKGLQLFANNASAPLFITTIQGPDFVTYTLSPTGAPDVLVPTSNIAFATINHFACTGANEGIFITAPSFPTFPSGLLPVSKIWFCNKWRITDNNTATFTFSNSATLEALVCPAAHENSASIANAPAFLSAIDINTPVQQAQFANCTGAVMATPAAATTAATSAALPAPLAPARAPSAQAGR